MRSQPCRQPMTPPRSTSAVAAEASLGRFATRTVPTQAVMPVMWARECLGRGQDDACVPVGSLPCSHPAAEARLTVLTTVQACALVLAETSPSARTTIAEFRRPWATIPPG